MYSISSSTAHQLIYNSEAQYLKRNTNTPGWESGFDAKPDLLPRIIFTLRISTEVKCGTEKPRTNWPQMHFRCKIHVRNTYTGN